MKDLFGPDSEILISAVDASMRVVRDYQLGYRIRKTAAQMKADGDENLSHVTIVDRESGKAAMGFLRELPPLYEIKAEDVAGRDNLSSPIRILSDNLDGTNPFLIGLPTSTVIIADYDKVARRVIRCFIGEPVRRRIWMAVMDGPTVMAQWAKDGTGMDVRQVSVWKGELSLKGSSIFLDCSHGFTRSGRQILTHRQVADLFARLNTTAKILMPGSNGLMQALVANGGEGLAGGITTAMGGEWDTAGVLLVLQAGGAARAFRRTLEEQDPLDPYAYDLMVFGNNRETVDLLSRHLMLAVGS